MSDDPGPESRQPNAPSWNPPPPASSGARASIPPGETPAPPSVSPRPPAEGGSPRNSLEPARLSVTMLDPDAMAPLFFLALFLATVVGLAYVFSSFASDFVLAFILVGLTKKPYERLRRRLGGRAVLASLLMTIAIAFGVIGPFGSLIYIIGLDATNALQHLPALVASVSEKLGDEVVILLAGFDVDVSKATLLDWLTQTLGSVQQFIVNWGGAVLSNAVAGSIHLLIILAVVFYALIDGHKLKSFLFDLSPLPDDEDALLIETFMKVSRGVVVGNGLASLLQGVLGGLALALAGIPSPVLWGGVMAFFAFLPLLGISVVTVPATLYLYLMGRPGAALVFFLFCSTQGFLVENIVKTKMMGSAMRMHDLMVFLSILGGLSAFGIIGFVYGPLIAMLFMTLAEMYQRRYRPRIVAQLGLRR